MQYMPVCGFKQKAKLFIAQLLIVCLQLFTINSYYLLLLSHKKIVYNIILLSNFRVISLSLCQKQLLQKNINPIILVVIWSCMYRE